MSAYWFSTYLISKYVISLVFASMQNDNIEMYQMQVILTSTLKDFYTVLAKKLYKYSKENANALKRKCTKERSLVHSLAFAAI